ncbi:MAG: hypothetical protein KIG18_02785, partial [Candidatus Methanomethylophilaceae archaeon]|nr:hypothetical protein [Candidatus Methanomethylophilaceae archaeon]
YEVIVRKSPDNNAKKVFKFCANEIKNIGLDVKNDDSAYCVIDVDYNSEDTLNKILKEAKKNNIHIILGSSTNRVGNHVHTGVVGAPRDYTL